MSSDLPNVGAALSPLEARALELAGMGLSLVPFKLADGRKQALLKDWPNKAFRDEGSIHYWFSKPGIALGIACGAKSGGVVLLDPDTDKATGEAIGERILIEAMRAHGMDVPDVTSLTYCERSQSGGLHLLFRASPEQLERIAALTPRGKKANFDNFLFRVDFKGDGGACVMAPSMGEQGPYTIVNGRDFAPLPEWVVDLLRESEERKAAQSGVGSGSAQATDGEPVKAPEKYYAALLSQLRDAGEGTRNETLRDIARDAFRVMTLNGLRSKDALWQELTDEALGIGLKADETQATLKSAWGYACKVGERKIASADIRVPGLDVRQAVPVAHPAPKAPEWTEPVPFEARALPPFPIDALPTAMGDFCAALAEEIQVPVELCFAMALPTLATVAQRSYDVAIPEGHTEPLGVWTFCPLEPGNRKSAVEAACTAPLRTWERRKAQELMPLIEEATEEAGDIKAMLEKLKAKCKTLADREAMRDEIAQLKEAIPEIPTLPRLLADDTTPEALATLMAVNGESMGLLSDEGGIFDTLAGRYSAGVPNLDLFLKSFSGSAVTIDRKNGFPILMGSPRLTLGITAQPCVISQRNAAATFRQRGMDGRFIFLLPESLIGKRKTRPQLMPNQVRTAWENVLGTLLARLEQGGKRTVLRLPPEGYDEWDLFAQAVEKELRDGGAFDGMKDWGTKFAGHVARVAGLLHLASGSASDVIPLETLGKAIRLSECLEAHARAAYELMAQDEATERGKAVLKWLRRTLPQEFTARQCMQALKGQQRLFSHMDGVTQALEELTERGYVRPKGGDVQTGRRSAGRPPSQAYETHPDVLKGIK